jgi:hypothetical protein
MVVKREFRHRSVLPYVQYLGTSSPLLVEFLVLETVPLEATSNVEM